VTLDTFRAICDQAPVHWRAFLALCRLGGLRDNEATVLPWDGEAEDVTGAQRWVGVDLDKGVFAVVGKGGRWRQSPIIPDLRPYLMAAQVAAAPDAVRVVEPITANNHPRHLLKFQKLAEVEPWRAPFHSLRASCVNDYKVGGILTSGTFPVTTYSAWLGHRPDVSEQYYQAPTEAELQAAISGAA